MQIWLRSLAIVLLASLVVVLPATGQPDPPQPPPSAAARELARDGISKALALAGLNVQSGSLQGVGTVVSNWDTLRNPCPCTLRLLDAMFKGLRDGEGQSYAFALVDCFKVPQLGGGTFAELQEQGEFLSSRLSRNKTANLNALRALMGEVRLACATPSSTSLPPGPPSLAPSSPVTAPPLVAPATPPPPKPVAAPGRTPTAAPPVPPVGAPRPTLPDPPAPPPLAWSPTNPCPACRDAVERLANARAALGNASAELADAERAVAAGVPARERLAREVAALRAQLSSQQGTGGRSTDSTTGVSVEATTDARGIVHVITRDAKGTVLEQTTRPRHDLAHVREELAAREAELAAAEAVDAQRRQAVDAAYGRQARARDAVRDAARELDDCLRRLCGGSTLAMYGDVPAAPPQVSPTPTASPPASPAPVATPAPSPLRGVLADAARSEDVLARCPECIDAQRKAKATRDHLEMVAHLPVELRNAQYDEQLKEAVRQASDAYQAYRLCVYDRCHFVIDPGPDPMDEYPDGPPSLQLQTSGSWPSESILDSIDDRESVLAVSVGGGPVRDPAVAPPAPAPPPPVALPDKGGGMQVIDPPATRPEPPSESILDEIDDREAALAVSVGGGPVRETVPECPQPPADQPLVVGANDRVGSGAQLRDKVKEKVGSVLGGMLGNRLGVSPSSGGSRTSGPSLARDPIRDRDKQEFTAPDGTRLRLGGRMTPAGPSISLQVEDSQGNGTYQSIFLEDADGRRIGPMQYLIYSLYQDWTLTVSWTRDTYVNGEHVSHEEGGWQEKGRNLLGNFRVPQPGEGVWKRLGFNNATRGVRGLGVVFPTPLQAYAMGPLATALVVHITRPRTDPVLTTPFIFEMMASPEGRLVFRQVQRTAAQARCRAR